MPSRNIIREFASDSYYHVYNRGVEKRVIFTDGQDYTVFLGLLKKYLTGKTPNNENRHDFKNFKDELSLLAYCLMPNHFHLLFYQTPETAITELMRRLSTSYSMYFNNRHNRVGSLFQGPYKASRIDADEYLHHISRYIHLNPSDYKSWPYSSLEHYEGRKKAKWLDTARLLSLFDNSRQEYVSFLEDYEANKKELDILKWQLANGAEVKT
jgi:putative transposase